MDKFSTDQTILLPDGVSIKDFNKAIINAIYSALYDYDIKIHTARRISRIIRKNTNLSRYVLKMFEKNEEGKLSLSIEYYYEFEELIIYYFPRLGAKINFPYVSG